MTTTAPEITADAPSADTTAEAPAASKKNAIATMLSWTRSLDPSHFLLYSTKGFAVADNAASQLPVIVREEPLRGLKGTSNAPVAERGEAILQVVEACELAPGHDTLVLQGRVLFMNRLSRPHSCNSPVFAQRHLELPATTEKEGGFNELGRRFAIQLAGGGFAWRNHAEAEEHQVTLTCNGQSLVFRNLLLDDTAPFSLTAPAYRDFKADLEILAGWISSALARTGGRGTHVQVRAEYKLGEGARVYASQEWAAEDIKRESKSRWKGGEGVTRILAKLRLPSGERQAIINDRKAGNVIRTIDDWYLGATPGAAIAVEPYGANSHRGEAFRSKQGSFYDLLGIVAAGKAASLTVNDRLYYAAMCIRGGVFGGKD